MSNESDKQKKTKEIKHKIIETIIKLEIAAQANGNSIFEPSKKEDKPNE